MNYLFVDKWADFSDINDNSRGNVVNPIFLMYASVLNEYDKQVHYINANDNRLTKCKLAEFINNNKVKIIIFLADIDNVNSILRLDLTSLNNEIELVIFSINENLMHFVKKERTKFIMFDERFSIENNFLIFLSTLNIISGIERIEKKSINYSLGKGLYKQ